jgi:hypothetical protein
LAHACFWQRLLKALRENEDVKESCLGVVERKRKSFRDVKHNKRRKRRWRKKHVRIGVAMAGRSRP